MPERVKIQRRLTEISLNGGRLIRTYMISICEEGFKLGFLEDGLEIETDTSALKFDTYAEANVAGLAWARREFPPHDPLKFGCGGEQ